MIKKKLTSVLVVITLGQHFCSTKIHAQAPQQPDLIELSVQFLENVKDQRNTTTFREQIARIAPETLRDQLDTDTKKKTFWINIYNAFIQYQLKKQPELYQNRGDFFGHNSILIAGEKISFDKIEHGILRRSQSKVGLGYVGKIFTDKFERELRVDQVDYRIHFALNCGAKSCPAVAVYSAERLDSQLNKGTQMFLQSSTEYDSETQTAKVTTLFSWFRGDFGGLDGVRTILEKQNLVPKNTEINLEFKEYDWTLDLGQFIDL